ncbi:MAG: hypothetical protein HQL12_00555 [Candidatus Omnitrophica bacterium]|nr:hypothetical protein [Candidatus Omnitrophota bacterium]
MKIKLLYLRIIKTCRFLSLSYLGMGVCLVFMLSSIIILNTTFFIYTPFSMEIKMWVGFLSAAVYFLIAIGAFVFVFSEKKWLFMFNAQDIFKDETGVSSLGKTGPDNK